MNPANSYSPSWFAHFHAEIPASRTKQEVEFISSVAPLPDYKRVLDLGCGFGRHSRALSERGYAVTAIDRDAAAIEKARDLGGTATFIHAEMLEFQSKPGAFDLVIVMSQSFGYFDAETNRELLGRLGVAVRNGGRVILDLWNPEFFIAHQGVRDFDLPSGSVREQKHIDSGRLFVHLDYPFGGADDFEWQLFTPSEMRSLAEAAELSLVVACTDFSAMTKPDRNNPRLQFVLERT